MELSKEEAHCLARVFQSLLYGGHKKFFEGCTFCKYPCRNAVDPVNRFTVILHKLEEESGVDLKPCVYGKLQHDGFPYKKFLKNANEQAATFFRNFFKDV